MYVFIKSNATVNACMAFACVILLASSIAYVRSDVLRCQLQSTLTIYIPYACDIEAHRLVTSLFVINGDNLFTCYNNIIRYMMIYLLPGGRRFERGNGHGVSFFHFIFCSSCNQQQQNWIGFLISFVSPVHIILFEIQINSWKCHYIRIIFTGCSKPFNVWNGLTLGKLHNGV